MTCVHGFLARCRSRFAKDRNTHSALFYRFLNEVPALLLVGIVILIIVKPSL
jgi:putative membrane protein